MQFELIVKKGIEELARVTGLERSDENLSMADVKSVIRLEQELENLFGLRFHINSK